MTTKLAWIAGIFLGLQVATPAMAGITAWGEPVTIPEALSNAGWSGYVIHLTADVVSQKVVGGNFKNDVLSLGGPIGIHATLHQSWSIRYTDNVSVATPVTTATIGEIDWSERSDSVFLNKNYYTITPEFSEDNNLANGSQWGYDSSPLSDISPVSASKFNGIDYGVGSTMTMVGFTPHDSATPTLDLALVIVPTGGVWWSGYAPFATSTIQGMAVDVNSTRFPIQLSYYLPEPASAGILMVAASSFLMRRSRHLRR